MQDIDLLFFTISYLELYIDVLITFYLGMLSQ